MNSIIEMLEDVCEFLESSYRPEGKTGLGFWPWAEMQQGFQNTFHTTMTIEQRLCEEKFEGEVYDLFFQSAKDILEKKLAKYDKEQVISAPREILLSVLDHHWRDHLLNMDHLKGGN